MKRGLMIVLLVAAVALVLAGCGGFRERAEEAETRIADAEETAQIAEQAAAQNTARILDLEDRVEVLEQQLEELCREAQADGS